MSDLVEQIDEPFEIGHCGLCGRPESDKPCLDCGQPACPGFEDPTYGALCCFCSYERERGGQHGFIL